MRRATEEHTWISHDEEGLVYLLVNLQLCVSGRAHPYSLRSKDVKFNGATLDIYL